VGWRRLTGRKANWAATSAAALAGLRRGLSGLLLQVATRWAGLAASAGWACWLARVG
jgi:hypothetical protein